MYNMSMSFVFCLFVCLKKGFREVKEKVRICLKMGMRVGRETDLWSELFLGIQHWGYVLRSGY